MELLHKPHGSVLGQKYGSLAEQLGGVFDFTSLSVGIDKIKFREGYIANK